MRRHLPIFALIVCLAALAVLVRNAPRCGPTDTGFSLGGVLLHGCPVRP